MKVPLLKQIVLEGFQGREETYAVTVVEGMMHGVAQSQILRLLLIIVGLCGRVEADRQCQG